MGLIAGGCGMWDGDGGDDALRGRMHDLVRVGEGEGMRAEAAAAEGPSR